jgi:hypothetical protein
MRGSILFVLALLGVANAFADESKAQKVKVLHCAATNALGKARPPAACAFDVRIDQEIAIATITWKEQQVSSKMNASDEYFADFDLPPDAEAGVWLEENEAGENTWVGMISISDDEGICNVKCSTSK